MNGKQISTVAPSLVDDSLSVPKHLERVEIVYPTIVRLRLNLPVRYVVNGEITSQKYVFERGGDIQEVNSMDAPALLSKVQKLGCCGAQVPLSVFELME